MDPVAASLSHLLTLNEHLVRQAVAGLSEDELLRQPAEGSNPMTWIVGHLVSSRFGLMTLVGGPAERPAWAPLFARGRTRESSDAYPPVAELLDALEVAAERLPVLMADLTETQWNAPSPRTFPIADRSVRGALSFMTLHESYHVGQLAYLRKWLGHSPLVG
jgi:hypothetical protein